MAEDIFELEDKRRLELGLKVRENIIIELTKNNNLPTDTSSREFLLRAIEGMDETILKKVKIKSEDKLQEAQNQVANNIAELLKKVSNSKQQKATIVNPYLDDDIVVTDPVEGETYIGVDSEKVKNEFRG
jgi:DNA primase catalytic subunit